MHVRTILRTKEGDYTLDGQLMFSGNNLIDAFQHKLDTAIARIKEFEPKDGYYLAFSGGKDSQVIYELSKMAGVKFDAHYNITTVDPPELLKFMKTEYHEVIFEKPKKYRNFWELMIAKKLPPFRMQRYCCAEMKEGGGEGRFVITGVRWAESIRRRTTRTDVEYFAKGKGKKEIAFRELVYKNNDNDERRGMIESCVLQGKFILNPIIDWQDEDVWHFINKYIKKHCQLYDEGFTRIGCIACPLAPNKQMDDFRRWPTIYKKYMKTFSIMVNNLTREDKTWHNEYDLMAYWLDVSLKKMMEFDAEIKNASKQ